MYYILYIIYLFIYASFPPGGGVLDPGLPGFFLRRGHGGVCELGMEGPEDVGGEGTLPLGERRTPPRGRSPILLLLN